MRSRLLLLLVAITAIVLVGAAPAGAHGDEGELTLTKVEQTGPTTVAIEVGIVYEGDQHLAEDAQVRATLTGPGGATVGPVELTRTGSDNSLYAATVEVPGTGDWSVEVTSTEPSGEVSGSVTVAEQSATSTTEATPTTEATTTTEAASGEAPAAITTTQEQVGEDDEGGMSPAVIFGACLVLAGIVIGGAVLVARSRGRRDDADPTGTDGPTDTDPRG
jgi:hypothetical protein